MERLTCSRGPMNSIPPSKLFTGLTNLPGVDAKKTPGKNFSLWSESLVEPESSLEVAELSLGGKKAISSVFGTHAYLSSVLC